MFDTNYKPEIYSHWRSLHSKAASSIGNARERAYLIIRDKIIYMELKPGEPLSDKVLAEQLQMSRTPVREALILLSAYNMVVLKPQIGTFVAPIDTEWVAMEQFSRLAMEKEIIRQACSRRDDKLVQRYEENVSRFALYENSDSPDRIHLMHELDNEFHGLACKATGRVNSYYHMLSYMQHIERLRALTLMMGVQKDINQDHREIAQAVAAGDEALALSRLEQHLSIYQDSMRTAQEQYPEYFAIG